MDTVPPRAAAHVEDRIAHAARPGVEDLVALGDPEGEGVDQDVAVVTAMEPGLAADRGDAHAIAIVADASDYAVDQEAHARSVDLAEAQGIHAGDRARAHGEDVAQDAAHAGHRSLVGLDEARMVVRLHLEDRHPAVPYVHDAGVLARPLEHVRPLGRKLPQIDLGGLVRTVLGPEGGGDAELGPVRIAAQDPLQPLVLLGGHAEGTGNFWRDLRLLHHHRRASTPDSTRLANRPSPSVLPRISSEQRSGW